MDDTLDIAFIIGLILGLFIATMILTMYFAASQSSAPEYKCTEGILYMKLGDDGPYVSKGHHCFNDGAEKESR